MSYAQAQANAFNNRIRVGDTVEVLMDEVSGQTQRHVLVAPAVQYLGELYVAEVRDLGLVAIQYIHLPAGVQG